MAITTIEEYLREFSVEIGDRILTSFPALHAPGDPVPPILGTLLRKPFAAQAVAMRQQRAGDDRVRRVVAAHRVDRNDRQPGRFTRWAGPLVSVQR